MLRQIALRNTIKNWRHSLSALLSLSASFVSLVLFDGYIDDVKKMYVENFEQRQMLGHVVIENEKLYSPMGIAEPWQFWISGNEQKSIFNFFEKKPDLVKNYVRSIQFQGMITNGSQSQILIGRAYDVERGVKMRGENWAWNTLFGRPLDLFESKYVATLGQGLAKKLACEAKKDFATVYGKNARIERPFYCPNNEVQISTMTVDGQINAVDLTVVGLVDAGYKDIDDRYILTSIEAAQTLLDTDRVTFVAVELQKNIKPEVFIEEFNKVISLPLRAVRWQNHRMGEMFKKTMDFLAIFRNFVIVVIVVVSTLSVMNTMIKIVKERSREIGTLRSLGFKAKEIMLMFFYESFYLSLIGTFLGVIFSIVLTVLLNSMGILYKAGLLSEPVAFRINFFFPAYIQAGILLISVGIVACGLSTKQLLNSKVIENLSHV